MKPIYSNSYWPRGNSKIENAHNFLKHTISKFLHNTDLEWEDMFPIATYIYNISPTVSGWESPFYLVFDRDPLKGRIAHLQGFCRYVGNQLGRQMLQELQKLWKVHAQTLREDMSSHCPDVEKEFDDANNYKIGQLVLIKK